MSSSYTLRPTSYTGDHLDRELTLRGARTSGTTQRKQQRLQRFVEAGADKHIEEVCVTIPTVELRRTIVRPPTQEVRRSTRISQLLREYLGY